VSGAGSQLVGYRSLAGEVTIPVPGSTLQNVPSGSEPLTFSGWGQVLTYTVVYVPTTRFKDRTPYVLAVIRLEEGASLMGIVDDGTVANLKVDAEVCFHHSDGYGHHFTIAR